FGDIASGGDDSYSQYLQSVRLKRKKEKHPKVAFKRVTAAVTNSLATAVISVSAMTPLNLPQNFKATETRTTLEAEKKPPLDKQRGRNFVRAVDILGVKHTEAAKITGISKSTLDKVSQDISPTVGEDV